MQLVCTYEEEEDLSGGYKEARDDWEAPYRKIRELGNDIEHLVLVSGIVVTAKAKRHKASSVLLRCKNCGAEQDIRLNEGMGGAQLPKRCDTQQNAANGGGGGVIDNVWEDHAHE